MNQEDLKKDILEKVSQYYQIVHNTKKEFRDGETKISYGGRIFDDKELTNLVDSALDFWLTYGKYSKKFEQGLANYLGIKHCSFVNSGSSANLLAMYALTSPKLEDRQLRKGDEVITIAAGFPTTIAPIIQIGATPVFVDINLETYNINIDELEKAISKKSKAIFLAHTLGNPFNIEAVLKICKKYNLWLIEDNCDALGSKYKGNYTGTFGDIGTSSFYPPHHITTGEGGAVYTDNKLLYNIINSFRDWGRDCWCESGKDDTCKHRFNKKYGDLPFGYDHKYVYSHLGFNLKATDMQAAIGCAQLEKLPSFIKKRQENFDILYNGLKDLDDIFYLPKATANSEPAWFGFILTVKDHFKRNDIVTYLEKHKIQTRNLFAGNLIKHPCFEHLKLNTDYKISGKLLNTDFVMNNSFWVGVYPGMKPGALDYIISKIREFVKK
jgi:CDP-4-dehydro-6-deoxyglucose reductase, E1